MTREEFINSLPSLIGNYQPAPDVLERLSRLALLMVIGPTGSGKTTLMTRSGIKHVLTDTTRGPRPGEVEAVDFFFRNDYEKIVDEIRGGRFAQVAIGATGDLYATRDSSYPEAGTVIMAVMADVVPIFRKLGFASTISAFITPPSYAEWQRRIGNHQLSPEELDKRLSEARRSLEFALNDAETHFILNDNLDEATSQLQKLVSGRMDADREEKAQACARELLHELKSNEKPNIS